jgi:hypothetical protein
VLRAVINPLKEQSPLLKSIKRDCIFYIWPPRPKLTCSETIYLLAKRILPLRYRFKIFGFLIKTISAWEHW